MKQRFEEVFAECLEAVLTGQRTIEECLALYPQWSARLERPLRLGSRLGHAPWPAPAPSFQEAARERFLAAAQARPAISRHRRRFLTPSSVLLLWRSHLLPAARWRSVAAGVSAAVLICFLGFSTFVLASAGDSLPGDWRYPAKRLTERARLAITFGDDARRGYRIDLAEERLEELQRLASGEREIDESVLRQVVSTTEPLIQALDRTSVPFDQIERITSLTAKQQDVLDGVGHLVNDQAVEELEEARVVSTEGHERALQALALTNPQQEPSAGVPDSASPEAGTPTSQASATAEPTSGVSADESVTPTPEPTPVPIQTTPVPSESTPLPDTSPSTPPSPTATASAPERQVVFLPEDTTAGVRWNLTTIGGFSATVPDDPEKGWVVSSLKQGEPGEVLFIGHRSGTVFDVIVTVTVSSGDASIYALVQGSSREISVQDLASTAPAATEVVLHVLASISKASP